MDLLAKYVRANFDIYSWNEQRKKISRIISFARISNYLLFCAFYCSKHNLIVRNYLLFNSLFYMYHYYYFISTKSNRRKRLAIIVIATTIPTKRARVWVHGNWSLPLLLLLHATSSHRIINKTDRSYSRRRTSKHSSQAREKANQRSRSKIARS